MPAGLNFRQICSLLPNLLPVPPFQVRYGPYAVTGGRAAGFRGFRGMNLVTAYAEGLKYAFDTLGHEVFTDTKPVGPIQVAVFHIPDYLAGQWNEPTTIPSAVGLRILLPNRSWEISVAARVDRARAEATHEVCHVYQFTRRLPQDDPVYDLWAWINDAAAVWAEQFVNRGGGESCFYCQDWLDSPEVPLDRQSYPSCMFIRWFASQFTSASVGRLWETARPNEGPLDIIERLHGPIADLFTNYARDGYFLCDPSSHCYYPDVHFLWGFREIRYRFLLPSCTNPPFDGVIDHLAAVYFEVRTNADVAKIHCVLVLPKPVQGVRAWISQVKPDLHRGANEEFKPVDGGHQEAILNTDHDNTDHYVIIVTNGSRRSDKVDFSLIVGAL
jgi:hypothetical protein